MDMIESDFGALTENKAGLVTLRYERTYPRPIDTVWSAITQPERLADWLGAAELEPYVGGRFTVQVGPQGRITIVGTVLAWEPPSVLACSWTWPGGGGTVIRYDLSKDGEQATRLTFTHSGLPAEQAHSVLPGWHMYLERLALVIGGGRPEPDFSRRHLEIQGLYGRRFGIEVAACQPAGPDATAGETAAAASAH